MLKVAWGVIWGGRGMIESGDFGYKADTHTVFCLQLFLANKQPGLGILGRHFGACVLSESRSNSHGSP